MSYIRVIGKEVQIGTMVKPIDDVDDVWFEYPGPFPVATFLEWDDTTSTIVISKQELPHVKRVAVDNILACASAEVTALVSEYPEYEQKTWGKQEQRAAEFTADNTADVPFLTLLAAERGIGVGDLVAKIQLKSALLENETGRIIGKRERLVASINSVPEDDTYLDGIAVVSGISWAEMDVVA